MRSVNHELEVRAKNTSENVCHKFSPRWMRMCCGSLLAVFNFSGESCAITLPEGNGHPHLSGNAAAGAATFPPKSTTVLTESVVSRRRLQQMQDTLQRDGHPPGPVVQFVTELVDGFLEQIDVE